MSGLKPLYKSFEINLLCTNQAFVIMINIDQS